MCANIGAESVTRRNAGVLLSAIDGASLSGRIHDINLKKFIRMIDQDLLVSERCMTGIATLEPGIKVSSHIHRDVEEINVVLEGEGVIVTDKGAKHVHVGDWQCIPKGVRHEHENTGKTPLTILWLCSPSLQLATK